MIYNYETSFVGFANAILVSFKSKKEMTFANYHKSFLYNS